MRTITVIAIILFIMTQVGAQESGSSLSKIRQKRSWVVDIFTMKRGFKGRLGYLTFFKEDNCKIKGPGIEEDPKGFFVIDKETKEMHVTGNANYDDRKNFTLIFECASQKHVYVRLAVEILIEEVYEPYFSNGTYNISIEEWMQQGTNLLTMQAPNGTDYKDLIFNVQVTPNPYKILFFIEKREISFKGCLDYENIKKYTVVVEARDQKILTTHSSTATVIINIIDKNDHKPVITGKKGNGEVKEREIGYEVYKIQVSDGDSPGSPGWRVKYTLYGEKAEYFKIEANPKTNEGILSVIKALDYEETQALNLTVQLENEEPLFSCSVQKMENNGNLWDVFYLRNRSSSTRLSLPITVKNVNDPPEFTDTIKHVIIKENTPSGHSLWTFTVTDQDQNPPNTHRFMKGKDIDNWVTIDSKTGKVSTAKVLDRESQFVTNSTYTVILLAVDDGTPPQTGTGTLIIHLLDENDNAPLLKDNKVTICLPESMTNITAVDLDLPPFSEPFSYELQDNKENWRIEPSYGETVNLINGSMYPGNYELSLIITDSGGLSSRQNLLVTVHNCLRDGKPYTIQAGAPGISIIFICTLLMLCMLLIMFKCSWGFYKAEKIPFPDFDVSKAVMRCHNEEGPGRDVEMKLQKELACSAKRTPQKELGFSAKKETLDQKNWNIYQKQQEVTPIQFGKQKEISVIQKTWKSHQEHSWNKDFTMCDDLISQRWTMLNTMIEKKLSSLHEQGNELCDYKPHPYDNEGEPGALAELDSLSMSEQNISLEDLQNLYYKFQRLAAQCRPDLIQHSYISQVSVSSHHHEHHHQHHQHHEQQHNLL